MEFNEVLKNRYSVRKFSNKPVEKEKINAILEAARIAPSAHNSQPTQIIVVKDEIEKIKEATNCLFNANVVFIVLAKEDNIITRKYGQIDASIAITQMMLEAVNQGLGTCPVGLFFENKLKELYSIPEKLKVVLLLMCGYIDDEATPADMHFKRKEISELAFKEEYNKKYE